MLYKIKEMISNCTRTLGLAQVELNLLSSAIPDYMDGYEDYEPIESRLFDELAEISAIIEETYEMTQAINEEVDSFKESLQGVDDETRTGE